MTYNEFINNIIETRGQWSDLVRNSELGCIRHHIIPKCMNGEPKRKTWKHHENIIWLFPYEHYIAHKLLALENPNCDKLQFAWQYMNSLLEDKDITEEEYNVLSKQSSEAISRNVSGKNNGRYGKEVSKQTRNKISNSNKGEVAWNKGLTYKQDNRIARNTGSKNGMFGKVGELNPMFGKHHSEESKLMMSVNHQKENKLLWKKVICVETEEVFESVKSATE